MSRISAAEKRQQQQEAWYAKNVKTMALFSFLQDLVQSMDPRIEDFEVYMFSYTEPDEEKPIPSFSFQNNRHSQEIGIHGHDSDIGGRFYIHARGPRGLDLYIYNHQLTSDQIRKLKEKLNPAVVEQNLRRESASAK